MRFVKITLLASLALAVLPLSANAATPEQQAFLNVAGPAARSVKAEYNIPASVTAAQAALESRWGDSGLSTKDKNYFGFKCTAPNNPGPIAIGCAPYQTTECTPTCHPVTAYFRRYASMTDSFRDYGRLLTTSANYAHALPYRNDPDEFIRRVAQKYATDPNYAGKVITVMRTHNLYALDSMPAPDVDQAGPALHEVRNVDGSWTGFAPLGADARDVAVATLPDGSSQVVIIGADDVVYHRARLADGSWTPFYALNGAGTDTAAKGKKISIAGFADGSAHVVIIGWDGNAYHRVRAADGSWTPFAPLGSQARDVSITSLPDGSAQVVILGGDDVVYHRVRAADGTWTPFAALNGAGTGAAAKGKKVSVSGAAGGSAHVVIVGWDGNAYHRVRAAAGSWTEFAALGIAAKDVTVAALADGSAQVAVIGGDDVVHHRVRAADGSWTPFSPVWGFGANAKGRKVSMAGAADGGAHLVIASF